MKTIIKRVLFIFLLLLTLNSVLADGFKNSVVNITFSKDLSGNVHINLISEKPYNNKVVVTKRAENRYIILLPEFDNKILPISDFGNLSDIISDISVSTIPYTDTGIKGYTKVAISTYNNVNIIATTSLKTNNPIESELVNKPNANNILKEVKQVSKPIVQLSKPEKKVVKQIIKKNNYSVKKVKTNIKPNNVVKNYSAPLKTKNIAVENATPVKQIAVNDKLSVEPTILNKENKLSDNEIKQQTINSESKIQKASLFISLINYIHSLGYKKTILLLSAIVFPIFVLFFIIFMNKKLKKKISNENYNNSQVEADNYENIVDESQAEVSNIQSFEDESQTNSVVTENFDDYEDTVNSEDNIIEADSNIVIEENDENYSSVEKSDEELLEEEQSILSNSDASFSEIISNDNLNENTEEETEVSVDNDIIEESFEEPVADNTVFVDNNIFSDDESVLTEVESQDEELEQIEFVQEYEEYEPEGSLNDFNSVDDSVFDNIQSINDDNIFEDLRNEYETTDEGLIILNQTKVNETSGFYLVNLDNHSSLIGYINEEIFVIKTFDEFVNEEIFVRQSEQLSETCIRYIVKVGLYKMVVDVADDTMAHVIDL